MRRYASTDALDESAEESWHSAHVHYHANQDDLLLDAVRPLLAEVRESVPRAYFVRHWRLGPHVRLHFRCTSDRWYDTVRPAVERTIVDYLRANPSMTPVDEGAEIAKHRELARLEREEGELTPFAPDNSLRFRPYEQRLHVLSTVEAAELLAEFHTDATDLVLAILEYARAGGDRRGACLAAMVAVAHTMCPPLTRGFVSFRSHAEGFLANCADPEGTRALFDRQYRRNAAALRHQVRGTLAALAGAAKPRADRAPDELGEFTRRWATLASTYRERALPLIAAGHIGLDGAEEPQAESAAMRTSDFHRRLRASDSWEALRDAEWFRCYRLLLNYLYLQMNRIGISPLERFLLCHLLAEAVEEEFHVRALDVVEAIPSENADDRYHDQGDHRV
ncbi:thiopeptide maturation pyridine synthase [Halostreptopolyspora alba]